MSHWAKLYRTGSQAYEINMYSLSPLYVPLDRQLLTRYSGISLQSDTRRAEEGDATVLSVDSVPLLCANLSIKHFSSSVNRVSQRHHHCARDNLTLTNKYRAYDVLAVMQTLCLALGSCRVCGKFTRSSS